MKRLFLYTQEVGEVSVQGAVSSLRGLNDYV
jgi:hypothetical protein